MPTRLQFFHNWRPSWISQNAQGWQVHTHLKTSTWTHKINNQKRKKTLSEIANLNPSSARL